MAPHRPPPSYQPLTSRIVICDLRVSQGTDKDAKHGTRIFDFNRHCLIKNLSLALPNFHTPLHDRPRPRDTPSHTSFSRPPNLSRPRCGSPSSRTHKSWRSARAAVERAAAAAAAKGVVALARPAAAVVVRPRAAAPIAVRAAHRGALLQDRPCPCRAFRREEAPRPRAAEAAARP